MNIFILLYGSYDNMNYGLCLKVKISFFTNFIHDCRETRTVIIFFRFETDISMDIIKSKSLIPGRTQADNNFTHATAKRLLLVYNKVCRHFFFLPKFVS